jgi:hypothetical protein
MSIVDDLRATPPSDPAAGLRDQAAATIERLTGRNAVLAADLTRAEDRNVVLTADLTQAQDRNAVLTTDLTQAQDRNAVLTADLTQAQDQNAVLTTDLTQARDRIAALTRAANQIVAATSPPTLQEKRQKAVEDSRKDLIRRLVAVAISVGFASQLVRIITPPAGSSAGLVSDSIHVIRLSTSMLVILLAWDWYHRDIEDKPLGVLRFLLDAGIVFLELALLLASSDPDLWSWLLAAIFAAYVAWDILAIIDCRAAFGFHQQPQLRWKRIGEACKEIGETYLYGFGHDAGFCNAPEKRGPPINAVWAIYFFVVARLIWWFLPPYETAGAYATCATVAIGAGLLWWEGHLPDAIRQWYWKIRIAILGIIIILAMLTCLFGHLKYDYPLTNCYPWRCPFT